MSVRTWDYMVCYKRSLFTAGKPHTEYAREEVYCLENCTDYGHPMKA